MVPFGESIRRGMEEARRFLSGETEQHLLNIVDEEIAKLLVAINKQNSHIQALQSQGDEVAGTCGHRIGYDLSLLRFGMDQLVESLERLKALRGRVTQGEIKTKEKLEKELGAIIQR